MSGLSFMKFTAMAICAAMAAFSAGLASAQGPVRRVCDPGNSEKTTVGAIAADPAAFLGRCVRVDAIYSNERLYADGDAIYGLNPKSIGGYVDGQGDLTGFWTGTFTGRVADCARAEDDLLTGLLRSPGISLNYRTLGCLTPEGPFLVFMSQGGLKPTKLTRRLSGAKGGDLEPALETWEQRREVERLAGAFLEALRASDRTALKTYVRNEYALDQLMAGQGTAIDALKTTKPRELKIFTHGSVLPDAFSSEACFCLTPDCARRWPIARRDADNQKGRPYACIRIDGVRKSEGWTYSLDPSRDFDGLPEPR